MPYIKEEARKIFDYCLEGVNKRPEVSAHLIHDELKERELEDIDGIMNYIITKLLMNKKVIEVNIKKCINILITDQYITNLRYYKINAFTGLIDNVLDNLEERGWVTEENIVYLCGLLVDYKETYVRPYEKKKREDNGDLV